MSAAILRASIKRHFRFLTSAERQIFAKPAGECRAENRVYEIAARIGVRLPRSH